jgi:hypothetical protein
MVSFVMPGTDQLHAALGVTDQPHAPQDEGAHDGLTDIGLARDQAAEIGPFDPDNARFASSAARDQDLAVVEQVHLAGELTIGVDREDVGLAGCIEVEDLDRARKDEKEVHAALAALECERSGGQRFFGSIAGHPVRLVFAQPRKGLRLSCIRIGRIARSSLSTRLICHRLNLGAPRVRRETFLVST